VDDKVELVIKYKYLENKLIAKIIQDRPYPFTLGKLYPRVTAIGGKQIHPDIDLLQIIEPYELPVGYEIKWLHHYRKGTTWYRFYQGIGQTLSYFLNGVFHAYLVLGWNNLPESDVQSLISYLETISEFVATDIDRKEGFKKGIYYGSSYPSISRCLGFIAFDKDKLFYMKGDPIKFREEFFPVNAIREPLLKDEIITKRSNLLSTKPYFTWDKKFIQKYG